MTESTKWPKHIEACIKAYLELGPGARFHCIGKANAPFIYVMSHRDLLWEVSPILKPDIKEWGNQYNQYDQYDQYDQLILPRNAIISWYDSFDTCVTNRRDSSCLAMHYRVIDGETGRMKLFETLEVFGPKAILSSGSDDK